MQVFGLGDVGFGVEGCEEGVGCALGEGGDEALGCFWALILVLGWEGGAGDCEGFGCGCEGEGCCAGEVWWVC